MRANFLWNAKATKTRKSIEHRTSPIVRESFLGVKGSPVRHEVVYCENREQHLHGERHEVPQRDACEAHTSAVVGIVGSTFCLTIIANAALRNNERQERMHNH